MLKVDQENWGVEVSGTVAEIMQWLQENQSKYPPNADMIIDIVTNPTTNTEQIAKDMPE
jgi:hypothetical protein